MISNTTSGDFARRKTTIEVQRGPESKEAAYNCHDGARYNDDRLSLDRLVRMPFTARASYYPDRTENSDR